ncbi:MAG: O-antigen ligase family protein [Betaproteobacteria bacterium]
MTLFGFRSTDAAIMALLAASLIVVWPLPHIIAVRNSVLFGLGIWLAYDCFRRNVIVSPESGLVPIIKIIIAFSGWMFVVALLIDYDPSRSLQEIKGQWLPAFVSFFAGIFLIWNFRGRQIAAEVIFRLLFGALLVLATVQLVVGYVPAILHQQLGGHFVGIFDHKANITYINAITASLLLADIVAQNRARRLLGLSRTMWVVALIILLLTTYLSGARNGVVVILSILLIGFSLYVRTLRGSTRIRIWSVIAILAIFFFVALWTMLKSDSRWSQFLATAAVAWNIDANTAWVNAERRPLPLASDGLPVEQTAYERISWALYAVRLIAEHPLGTAVSRNSFRELVDAKFGEVLAAHSHNGYLDLALSLGLPALFLWIAFLVVLVRQGYMACLAGRDGAGLALILLVVAYSIRAILDSIWRDHILHEFMFFAGLLLAASSRAEDSESARNA